MRIEPVYLVAPKKKPPSMPTRRAFLLAGGMFAAGLGVGGACGYAAGVAGRSAEGEGDGRASELPPPSGDALLDELRRLAVEAPIEELVERWLDFVDTYSLDYRNDPILPQGVERLVDHVLASPSLEQRRLRARVLRDIITRGEPRLQRQLAPKLSELQQIIR